MELLGDLGQVESRFFMFGDRVSVGVRLVHGLRYTYHRIINHFGRTRWYHLVMRLKWKLVSVHVEIVLMLSQDRCTVCIKRRLENRFGRTRWNS